MRHEEFFRLARERYNIFLKRRAGEQKPWTTDDYLRQFKFCNVFREDDATTIWIRENIRDPLRDSPSVFQAMVIARWFNRISTLEILKEMILEDSWTNEGARALLENVQPLITAAYMIRTPTGTDKLTGLLWNIDQALPAVREYSKKMKPDASLEETTHWLAQFPNLGNFLAYEVITDLRHTALLENAPDIMDWANPGPGAERGIERFVDGSAGSEENQIRVMQEILAASTEPQYWPAEWPKWEMRDAEHVLCEFDKYERVRLGEGTPKQRYDGGGSKTIMYGQGGKARSPRAPSDPLTALINQKLGPHREMIGKLKLEIGSTLVKAVKDLASTLIEGKNLPINWLPLVDSVMVTVDGRQMELTISPPERMPAFMSEIPVEIADPHLEAKMSEIAKLEETTSDKERALRSALEAL